MKDKAKISGFFMFFILFAMVVFLAGFFFLSFSAWEKI